MGVGLGFEGEDCLAAGALGFWGGDVSYSCLMVLLDGGIVGVPSSSATFMRKALRSSRTRLRPRSMKSSKRWVNWVIRSRRSLKPKSMEGRVSAMEGASVLYCACEAEKEAPKRLGVAGIAAIVVDV
jgi:hypothetical protein